MPGCGIVTALNQLSPNFHVRARRLLMTLRWRIVKRR
jgi:hypothetical protein